MLDSLLKLLQASALGQTVRSAAYVYPALEAVHILGIGLGHRVVSVTAAARGLLPLSRLGFAIAMITGLALLSAQATMVAAAGTAPWKLGLLILACLNVLVFHFGIYRRVSDWDTDPSPPVAARAAAVVSLIAWTGMIFAGRFLAYS